MWESTKQVFYRLSTVPPQMMTEMTSLLKKPWVQHCGVTPYNGPQHTEWLFDYVCVPNNKPVAQVAVEFLNRPTLSWSATQLICFLIECQGVPLARLLDRTFCKAQSMLSRN